MNDTITTQLTQYLHSYGWEYSQEKDKEFLIRFMGEESNTEFHLIIGTEQLWVTLTIWPYLPPFPDSKQMDALQLLCKRNFQMRLARLGMTENGEATLCVDLPMEGLTEKTFHLGLDVISNYADTLYPEFVLFWSKE